MAPMVEPQEETSGFPSTEGKKVELGQGADSDPNCVTFVIRDEDHTIGNSLRYILMKNPDIEFCGYAIPHPSEYKINLRIQTNGNITAVAALTKGLDDLMALCNHVRNTFITKRNEMAGDMDEDE
ncbi:hypothetical protein HK101_010701 [Irineochytrium annulatum]|nr:hypothetical protein HK101_010701 [Irineochytrium annulatum]